MTAAIRHPNGREAAKGFDPGLCALCAFARDMLSSVKLCVLWGSNPARSTPGPTDSNPVGHRAEVAAVPAAKGSAKGSVL